MGCRNGSSCPFTHSIIECRATEPFDSGVGENHENVKNLTPTPTSAPFESYYMSNGILPQRNMVYDTLNAQPSPMYTKVPTKSLADTWEDSESGPGTGRLTSSPENARRVKIEENPALQRAKNEFISEIVPVSTRDLQKPASTY